MGRECHYIGLKEDRLGKQNNLWVEKFISFGKVNRLGRKKYVRNF